jgi:hypothetical protein
MTTVPDTLMLVVQVVLKLRTPEVTKMLVPSARTRPVCELEPTGTLMVPLLMVMLEPSILTVPAKLVVADLNRADVTKYSVARGVPPGVAESMTTTVFLVVSMNISPAAPATELKLAVVSLRNCSVLDIIVIYLD